jgi:hypothetical protein
VAESINQFAPEIIDLLEEKEINPELAVGVLFTLAISISQNRFKNYELALPMLLESFLDGDLVEIVNSVLDLKKGGKSVH